MAIKFHCQYCGKKIEAPDKAAGKRGKCPSCHNKVYIPDLNADGDLKLKPVDEEEEQRKKKLMQETYQLERTILSEKESDSDTDSSNKSSGSGKSSSEASSDTGDKKLENIVVNCLRNMIDGRLGEVDKAVPELAKNQKQALQVIDRIASRQSPHPKLSDVPQRVLEGFIRELRGKLT